MKRVRNLVDAEERLEHAKSPKTQGCLQHIVVDTAAELWSDVLLKLPLSVAINAVQDTLPHNANLSVWRKQSGLSGHCKLCDNVRLYCMYSTTVKWLSNYEGTIKGTIASYRSLSILSQYHVLLLTITQQTFSGHTIIQLPIYCCLHSVF